MSSLLEDRPLLVWCGIPLLLISSLHYLFPGGGEEILGLLAANTLITHTYVWNLLTSCFFETNLFKLALDLFCLFGISKWVVIDSLEQFLLYFVFSILSCTIGSSIYCFARFVFSGHDEALIVPIYGFDGVLISLMMFVRYRLKSQIILPQLPQLLTYQNLPIAFLSFHTVLVLLGLKWFTKDLSFMCFSLLFSWSYLRFYYKWDENDVIVSNARGEDLSFVAMFPEVSHIVLVPFTTAFYNIMVLLGLFPPLEAERRSAHHLRALPPPKEDAISPKIASAPVDLVGERRRAKALKLLDAKMAELAREPEGWDDVAGEIEGNEDQTFELSKLKV